MTDIKCEYCKPWYNPKPIIDTPHLFIRLSVMNDMYRYVQIFWRRRLKGKWHLIISEPIDKCPMCGGEV